MSHGPNREDVSPIEPYESTPPKLIAHLDTVALIQGSVLRLYFSIPLKETPALFSPATYRISGPTPVTVLSVRRYQHKKIELLITSIQVTGDYYLSVVENILDINENIVIEPTTPIIFAVGCVQVLQANAVSTTSFNITFSEAMRNNADLVNPTNYALIYTCDQIAWDYTTSMTTYTDLTITFTRDMVVNEDLCNPTHYSLALVPSPLPLTYTVAMPAALDVRVTYSNTMEINTDLIDPSNYVISYKSGLLPALSYSVAVTSPTEITITFTNSMDINTDLIDTANYTITL